MYIYIYVCMYIYIYIYIYIYLTFSSVAYCDELTELCGSMSYCL